ncbi:hypothetical protein Hdeb2414_s0102g00794041 [Helianthus debilis subsp. tardiflorus]
MLIRDTCRCMSISSVKGNFRLSMSKFIGEVLTGYSLHISQISALGLPRITHFEFICQDNRVEPSFEKFNVFYFVTYTGGLYSFSSRTTGVDPCSRDPLKSLHDWKQKFYYIRRGVIPIDMHYRAESERVPRVNVSVDFTEQEWYKVLTRKVTPIIQLEERALVAAGMSMLWATQNPQGFPIYGYQGKVGYSLINVFDPKAGGAMVVVTLPEGRPLWVEQIRDNFLHPTSESMVTYANTILAEDDRDDIDVDPVPTRGEVIILSSEGSDESHQDLIHRSARAGPQRGTVHEPVADDVETPVENPQAETAEQIETRKKRKKDKTKEKKAEEPVIETPRKKLLRRKRKELDAQAAATLAEKKSKLQKDIVAAPSESEIDLGVFSAKAGNRLEKMYKSASGSRDFAAGAGGGEARGEGVETEVESSEATSHATIYTKRVQGSRGGGASGTRQSPEFQHVQGGCWTTHNPACDDLPHAPH